MNPQKAAIIGSIAAVVVGLGVTGIIIYRQRSLSEVPAEPTSPSVNAPTTAAPSPVDGTKNTPPVSATTTPSDTPAGVSGVIHVAPDYTGAPDTDNDGLNDPEEALHATDPNKPDSDGDGLKDGEEVHAYGTDPLDPKSNLQSGGLYYDPNKK